MESRDKGTNTVIASLAGERWDHMLSETYMTLESTEPLYCT